jgi:flavin-dependent trigonelline monooxygenase, reductase component
MQHQIIRTAGNGALDIAELRRTLGSFATGVVEAGDHLVLIGKVVNFGHSPANQPLGYHRGSYIAFGLAS